MAPRHCRICSANAARYTCARCSLVYCSVPCYRRHSDLSCEPSSARDTRQPSPDRPQLPPPSLRPLTSLNWPYIPDQSAYPDPLKRDDPKALQLHQYEAIATSPALRRVLSENERLPELLVAIDKLRGSDRDQALQRALGLTAQQIDNQLRPQDLSEDVLALRRLAEAVEAAVRGGDQRALGLDWD